MDWGQFCSWIEDKSVHSWAYFNGFGINAFINIPVIPAKTNLPRGVVAGQKCPPGPGGAPTPSQVQQLDPFQPGMGPELVGRRGEQQHHQAFFWTKKTATNFHLPQNSQGRLLGEEELCWESWNSRCRSLGADGCRIPGRSQPRAGSAAPSKF